MVGHNKKKPIFAIGVMSVMFLLGVGCSSTPEEPSSSRTTQDVRGDSDRFFQQMGEEEKKK